MPTHVSGPRVCDDVSAAAWIAPRLAHGLGAVGATVPRGYAAYARICHPVTDREGDAASWTAVATATGRRAHPLMQWHALVGSADPLRMAGSHWPGSDPQRGNLEPAPLAELCSLLREHTATAESCFFCLWEGYGWIDRAPTALVARRAGAGAGPARVEPRAPAFTAAELRRPRVELPHRRYLLLAGPRSAAGAIGRPPWRQSPNLFWPADRAWCVASELDFDSTLVGGSGELISAILAAPALDAWPVEPGDSLRHDGDLINATAA